MYPVLNASGRVSAVTDGSQLMVGFHAVATRISEYTRTATKFNVILYHPFFSTCIDVYTSMLMYTTCIGHKHVSW